MTRRWPRIASGEGAVRDGIRAPEDQTIKTQAGNYQYREPGRRPALTLIAVAFLTIEIAFLFADLSSAAETSKSDWWPSKQYSWTDVLLVLITMIYVIVTAAYVAISKRQWAVLKDTLEETRRSNAETQRSNAMTLRAWMIIEDITVASITKTQSGAFQYIITVTYKNVGTLPALNIQTTQRGGLLEANKRPRTNEDIGVPVGLVEGSNPVCGGGQSHKFDIPSVLPPNDAIEIMTGASRLWLHIEMAYTDPIGTDGATSITAAWHSSMQRFSERGSSVR